MEMAYCHDQAIPHSRFLEEWSEEDRSKLFAYIMEKAERCQMCGTAPWEWEENKFAYVPVHQVCLGCQKKDVLRDDDEKPPAGSSIVLIPGSEAERLEREKAQRRKR